MQKQKYTIKQSIIVWLMQNHYKMALFLLKKKQNSFLTFRHRANKKLKCAEFCSTCFGLFITLMITLSSNAVVHAYDGPQLTFELQSGRVIHKKRANDLWYPASTTKLMTAYVTFKAIQASQIALGSPVRISKNARSKPPSKMGFKVGTKLTIDNALKMVIVKSANDIAVALAEAVAGSETAFVKRMNAQAKQLGMSNTHFTNPHGLPDKKMVTTAHNLGLLARALILEFPQYRHYFRIANIQHGKRTLRSYNPLLERYRGATGLKTGFTCASGFNLVASATRNGKTIIGIILGARSSLERAAIAKRIMDKGFSFTLKHRGKVTNLKSSTSAQPIDMRPIICKKNGQPSTESILAKYAINPKQAIAYARSSSNSKNMKRTLANAIDNKKTKQKKKNKKIDLYSLVVGPPIYQRESVAVWTNGIDKKAPQTRDRAALISSQPILRPLHKQRQAPPQISPSLAAKAPTPKTIQAVPSSPINLRTTLGSIPSPQIRPSQ